MRRYENRNDSHRSIIIIVKFFNKNIEISEHQVRDPIPKKTMKNLANFV